MASFTAFWHFGRILDWKRGGHVLALASLGGMCVSKALAYCAASEAPAPTKAETVKSLSESNQKTTMSVIGTIVPEGYYTQFLDFPKDKHRHINVKCFVPPLLNCPASTGSK